MPFRSLRYCRAVSVRSMGPSDAVRPSARRYELVGLGVGRHARERGPDLVGWKVVRERTSIAAAAGQLERIAGKRKRVEAVDLVFGLPQRDEPLLRLAGRVPGPILAGGSHGQVAGRGLGRRGGWKIEEGWSTGTRRASSPERTRDPGSARTGGGREMAQSPSPSVMTSGTVESGTAGIPEQSAPEQGVGRDGGVSS